MNLSSLHPYGKAIAGAVSAAIGALLSAYADLPPWVGVALTLVGTLVTIYFAANTPADPPAVDPTPALAPYDGDVWPPASTTTTTTTTPATVEYTETPATATMQAVPTWGATSARWGG